MEGEKGGVAAVEIVAQPLAGIQFELELCLRLISANPESSMRIHLFFGLQILLIRRIARSHWSNKMTISQQINCAARQPGS